MSKKSGFTLAEIIITLSIIGVVAAMTIPNIVQNIQDQQFRTAWKKAYSELDQATRLIMSENGGTMTGLCGDDWRFDCLLNVYAKRLNYIRKCYAGDAVGNCWVSGYRYLDGSIGEDSINYSRAILSNGTLLRVEHTYDNCNFTAVWAPIPICGDIYVDVNGYSAPNTVGKDIFSAWIQRDGLKPVGADGDTSNFDTNCTKNGSGLGCSALYLYQ